MSEKVDPHLYEPLSVGQLGVTPQLEGVAQQQGDGEKKLVRPGQIAMNSRSDRRGASGLSKYEGVVSVVYTVLQPDLNHVYPRFAHYLFRSLDFQNEYYRWGTGIVDDLWSTKFERLAQIRIPLPDLETQRRIADYLDKEICEMDALIEEFERLVENLKNRKTQFPSGLIPGIQDAIDLSLGGSFRDSYPEVPFVPIRLLGRKNAVKNTGMLSDNLLSLSYGNIVRKPINAGEGLRPDSYETYQVVQPGQTVLCLLYTSPSPRDS